MRPDGFVIVADPSWFGRMPDLDEERDLDCQVFPCGRVDDHLTKATKASDGAVQELNQLLHGVFSLWIAVIAGIGWQTGQGVLHLPRP